MTLFPDSAMSPYGVVPKLSLKEFIQDKGYLKPSKIKDYLDRSARFKLFASAKFNAKKYAEDKESILSHYNSLGYRDAVIEADTQSYNSKGKLNVSIKINEGNKYKIKNLGYLFVIWDLEKSSEFHKHKYRINTDIEKLLMEFLNENDIIKGFMSSKKPYGKQVKIIVMDLYKNLIN